MPVMLYYAEKDVIVDEKLTALTKNRIAGIQMTKIAGKDHFTCAGEEFQAGALLVPSSARRVTSHGGQGESPVPPYSRGSASLSHGGQGKILVPPCTHGSVSLFLSL